MNPKQPTRIAQQVTPTLVAILRGLQPERATDIADALCDAGFRWIEVPLNRPGAIEAIARIAANVPQNVVVGGGTMLSVQDVDRVAQAGGRMMVSPNCNPVVISHAVAKGLYCAPGVATPTEAFAALEAGAHALKLFPAEVIGPRGLRALRSVVDGAVPWLPVGGITPESLAEWRAAGAAGFGVGTPLFQPQFEVAEIARRARCFIEAFAQT